jgi:N-acetylmuramoyl-L-alanine amidase CwlA
MTIVSKTIKTGWLSDVKVNGIAINTSKPCNSGNYSNCASRDVSYVVMHYTGNAKDTASANCGYFQSAGRGASAHLFVDESHIYQSVELRDRAWHCGASSYKHKRCRNANAIGIEMCTSGNYAIAEKTRINAAYLCAHLCKLLGISADKVDTYVVRHWDVTGKDCPHNWTGSGNANWTAFKAMVKNILKTGKHIADSSFRVKVVNCTTLNVRKSASASAAIVKTIKAGEIVTITTVSAGGKWYKLKSGGWIAKKYTKKI